MKLSPEDHRLRKKLRDLVSENSTSWQQKVMFIDHQLEVREVLYEPEITAGGHVLVRDRLLDQAELKAILHLGLVSDGYRRAYIHVVDSDADLNRSKEEQLETLLTLRQANNHVYWVPTSWESREAWSKSWFQGQ